MIALGNFDNHFTNCLREVWESLRCSHWIIFFRFILDESWALFWRAASRRLSRPTATARQLQRRSCGFHVNPKSWPDRSSLLSLAPGEGENVAGCGEKDGKPAEKAGSHDQRPAVCDQLGKFAGKFAVAFHECLMHFKAPLPKETATVTLKQWTC